MEKGGIRATFGLNIFIPLSLKIKGPKEQQRELKCEPQLLCNLVFLSESFQDLEPSPPPPMFEAAQWCVMLGLTFIPCAGRSRSLFNVKTLLHQLWEIFMNNFTDASFLVSSALSALFSLRFHGLALHLFPYFSSRCIFLKRFPQFYLLVFLWIFHSRTLISKGSFRVPRRFFFIRWSIPFLAVQLLGVFSSTHTPCSLPGLPITVRLFQPLLFMSEAFLIV